MYFMGISKTFIIGGRLVSGIGLGCLGCLFSDIIKNTHIKERSTRLSRIMVGRQVYSKYIFFFGKFTVKKFLLIFLC